MRPTPATTRGAGATVTSMPNDQIFVARHHHVPIPSPSHQNPLAYYTACVVLLPHLVDGASTLTATVLAALGLPTAGGGAKLPQSRVAVLDPGSHSLWIQLSWK